MTLQLVSGTHQATLKVLDVLALQSHIPAPIWFLFGPLHKIQAVWHFWRAQKEIRDIVQPEHGETIADVLLMRGAEYALSNVYPLRVASYFFLLMQRITKCRQIMQEVSQTLSDLGDALRGADEMESITSRAWIINGEETAFLSPSTKNWFATKKQQLCHNSYQVVACVGRLFSKLFELSMYILETIDVCFIDLNDPKQSVKLRDIFKNGLDFTEQLLRDHDTALRMLAEEKDTVNSMLKQLQTIGCTCTYEGLVNTINSSKRVTSGVHGVMSFGNGMGGRAVSQLASSAQWLLVDMHQP